MKMSKKYTLSKVHLVTREEDSELWICAFNNQDADNEHALKLAKGSWESYSMEESYGPFSGDLQEALDMLHMHHSCVSVKLEESSIYGSVATLPEEYYR
jgi:hypothetical protein